MRKLWSVEGRRVMRNGIVVAYIQRRHGKLNWVGLASEGLNMQREGFDDLESLVADVKYFHRYKPPMAVFRFESGRTVEVR